MKLDTSKFQVYFNHMTSSWSDMAIEILHIYTGLPSKLISCYLSFTLVLSHPTQLSCADCEVCYVCKFVGRVPKDHLNHHWHHCKRTQCKHFLFQFQYQTTTHPKFQSTGIFYWSKDYSTIHGILCV